MTWKYKDPMDWIKDCKRIVRRDLDNVILFTGPEGQGKSTIMFQVMRALDPEFSAERIHFGTSDFLANAPSTPKYGAVAADEIESLRRRAMSKLTKDLMQFLKDCRGLNLHIGICFPHEALFEGAILNFRVRWQVHVPKRGLYILSERQSRQWRNPRTGEVRVFSVPVERGKWTSVENSGPLWEEYRRKKDAHMLSLGSEYRNLRDELSSGVDHDRSVDRFRRLLGDYEKSAGPGATIHEVP